MDVKITYNPNISLDDFTEKEQEEIESDLEILSLITPKGKITQNAILLDAPITNCEIEVLPRKNNSWRYQVKYFSSRFSEYLLGELTYGREKVKELK